MRIFCAVRHSRDPSRYFGGLWSRNFYPALRRLGHEIVESQVDLLPTSRFMDVASDFTQEELEVRARTTQQILDEVRAAHERHPVEVFLSYFYNSHFDPAGFAELRRLNIPSVNFYCNSIYQFNLVERVAAHADFAWHTEKDAASSYRAVGANPVWVQMGADPDVYYPHPNTARTAEACFVGQRYADRDRWLAALIRARVPVVIYGAGWSPSDNANEVSGSNQLASYDPYLGRSRRRPGTWSSYVGAARATVETEGMWRGSARLARQWQYRASTRSLLQLLQPHCRGGAPCIAEAFSRHEVCLNLSNVWSDGRPGSALIPHIRLRDFEGPMCRTCYLTGHTDEIEEFYRVGTEIETYRSTEEFVDKSRYLLAHPQAAEQLREAAYRRARRDHTWDERFKQLFCKIGLHA